MLPSGLEIVFVALFVALHGFFSLSETSVLSVRKSRLREMRDDEDVSPRDQARASLVLKLKMNPEHFVATMQTGTVLSQFLAASFLALFSYDVLGPAFEQHFAWRETTAMAVSFGIAILAATLLDIIFGALIPKSIALHRSQSIAFRVSPILDLLVRGLKPITHLPVLLSNVILRPFKDSTSFTESRISEEEFRVMLEEGARTGVIDKTENELIENIFDFRLRTVREVMVPRIKLVGIDVDSPREQVIERIIAEGYTRLPVYQDSMDNILGVIYSKDVLALIEHPDLIILHDIIRPTPFVPETKLIAELLREFQRQKLHIAIVLDEFGGTAGIVTLEDIIEEIVGEIHDEYDEDVPAVTVEPHSHSLVLSTSYSIADANEYLEKQFKDFQIPNDEEYETVSGFVNKLFEHIPEVGDERETHGINVVVQKRAPNRVLQVRFEDRSNTKDKGDQQETA